MNNATQRLSEIEAQEKALADEKVTLLAASKDADLELVKKLCKQHGFTATQLRGSLKIKGKTKAKGEKAVAKKIPAKKTPAKK